MDDPSLAATDGNGEFLGLSVVDPLEATSSSGGWFGGLFSEEEEKKPTASGAKLEILESFDTPSTLISSFQLSEKKV